MMVKHGGRVYILFIHVQALVTQIHGFCFQEGLGQLNVIKCTGAVTETWVRERRHKVKSKMGWGGMSPEVMLG